MRVERNGPVTTVIMNRPEARNAVNGPAAAGALRGVRRVRPATTRRRSRCCGVTTEPSAPEPISRRSARRTPIRCTAPGRGRWGRRRMVLSKPVIAAVSGHAVAGGLELALWCDLRVVEEDAVFGVFCRRWGVPLIDGGTVRLPRLIGHSRAMDLILTGRAVDAEEAYAIGLANRVVPKGEARRTGRGAGRRTGRAAAAVPARRPAVGAATSGACPKPRRWTSSSAACRGWPPNHWQARSDSPAGAGGTARAPRAQPF